MDMEIHKKRYSILLLLLVLIAAGAALPGCKEERFIHVQDSVDDPFDKPVAVYYDKAIIKKAERRKAPGKFFDYRQMEFVNGMKVITVEDFSCPIVAVQVWYHVGSKNENPERQGFAHMFEHMMFKGTDLVGEQDHFNFIQLTGGSSNGYTSYDTTVYLETLPADQIELALWLEAERMSFLKIDQERFDTERKVVEEELRMGENKPYGGLHKKEAKALFKVHPYRWTPIGSMAHLRATSVAELRDFWTSYYAPNNATLVIIGAVKHAKAQELAQKYFGWIRRWDEPKPVREREPAQTKAKTVVIKDENAPAGMVEIIWRTIPLGHEDEAVLDLLSSVLGGGNSSRLYRDIVAERQLAVAAEASSYNLEHDGVFQASATYNPGTDPNELIKIINAHIEDVKSNGISEKELDKAKNNMLKGLVVDNLTINSKARMIGAAAVIKGDVERANTRLDEIKDVRPEDIKRIANNYLKPEKATTFLIMQNTKGAMAGKKDSEEAAVTAEPELKAPPAGRKGAIRPRRYPTKAPFAELKAEKFTPVFTRTELDNGMKVIVIPNDEVPFVSVRLGFINGAVTEDKPGTANMAAKMITKGTAKHSEAELTDLLEQNAIGLAGFAGMDTSTVEMNCLTEHTELALKLAAEVVREPTFEQGEFDKLKKQVLTSLNISSQQPRYLVSKQFRKVVYGNHPYSRTVQGLVEDVENLKPEDLKAWWSKFIRPDAATIIFAGDITQYDAVDLAKKMFGDWKDCSEKIEMELAEIPPMQNNHIYIVDRPGSMQSEVRVGQTGITRHVPRDYFISRVVSNYFGWAFNSRLNQTIRVEKGLTYAVWGDYTAQNLAGIFRVATFTKTETTDEMVQAIIDEISKLANEPPTEKELNDSKTYFAGSFVRNREIPQQVASDLWLIESQNLGGDYLDNLLKTIANTTKEDCVGLAKRTLDPDKLVIVVVGDAEKIKDDLEKIAPVTVIAQDN
jgi:zinc protease